MYSTLISRIAISNPKRTLVLQRSRERRQTRERERERERETNECVVRVAVAGCCLCFLLSRALMR
ncbi:hypothetical protein LguiB_006650 [Lonicera macranthoides]